MDSFYLAQQPVDLGQPDSVAKPLKVDYALGIFMLALPILLAIGFWARRKHRSVSLRRRVTLLEKLWLLEAKEPRF